MTKDPTFNMRFQPREIAELTRRYDYPTDHNATTAGRQARERGHYTKTEFMAVCRWKSPRSSGRAAKNSPATIYRQTRIALGAHDEAERMHALTELAGVGVPVASTLLHFAFPRRYPIIDWRALESLGQKRRSQYPISYWLAYLDACRRIARENNVQLRTLDKALWQYSRESPVSSIGVTRPPRDPARGLEAARKLKALGVKGILIKAADEGYITQVTCRMPECFCPEELGGACHFEPVADKLTDWMPTHEHFPRSKREGGHRAVANAVLAHRLCNRIDYSISVGRSYEGDLERVRNARQAAAES